MSSASSFKTTTPTTTARTYPSWAVSSVFLSFAIFLLSQFGVLFITALVMNATGRSSDEVGSVFGDDSYWPKFIVYALIVVAMVWLTKMALHILTGSERKKQLTIVKPIAKQSSSVSVFSAEQGEHAKTTDISNTRQFLLLPKNRPSAKQLFEVFAVYGLYFICLFLVSGILSAIGVVDASQNQDLGIGQPETRMQLLAVFLMLVVLPPIGEEVLFRGFLYNTVTRYSSAIYGYIITSVLFGLAHLEIGGENLVWIAVVDTLLFSAFLIFISQRHRSLYSSMLLHALKNMIAFYVLFGSSF